MFENAKNKRKNRFNRLVTMKCLVGQGNIYSFLDTTVGAQVELLSFLLEHFFQFPPNGLEILFSGENQQARTQDNKEHT